MTTREQKIEIAQTIMNQFGGRRFGVMVGVKDIMATDLGVQFKIGRFAGVKCTHVRVNLTEQDLYDVQFLRVYAGKCETLATEEGIYDDMLAPIFRKHTGLETRL